jgi:hypothetical protein
MHFLLRPPLDRVAVRDGPGRFRAEFLLGFGERAAGPLPNPVPVNGDANDCEPMVPSEQSSPRRTQLEPGFIERGTLRLKRLRRAAVIEIIPWNGSSEPELGVPATPKEPRDPLKLARYYQSLLDSGQFENRAALARYLGVSRARVTQVLRRLQDVRR